MRKMIGIMAITLFVFPALGIAEEFVFEKGKGVEVCEEYHKNIELYRPRDIACDREFDAEFKDFKKPQWEKWDLTANRDLAIKIKKFMIYGDQFAKIQDLDDEKHLVKDLRHNPYFITDVMHFARIDINNDGDPKNIILYSEGRCMRTRPFARLLLVLNEDKTFIDVEKTDPLMQNPSSSSSLKARMASHDFNTYDVFTYKGRTYFDDWFGSGTFCKETLRVYELSNNKTKEICRYKCMVGCK
jgi:hypothetical protein